MSEGNGIVNNNMSVEMKTEVRRGIEAETVGRADHERRGSSSGYSDRYDSSSGYTGSRDHMKVSDQVEEAVILTDGQWPNLNRFLER